MKLTKISSMKLTLGRHVLRMDFLRAIVFSNVANPKMILNKSVLLSIERLLVIKFNNNFIRI